MSAASAQRPRIDPDQDALVISETMLAAIAFDVKLTIGIALHLPHRLIRYAAMSLIKLHQTTSAQAVDTGVLPSVNIRFCRAVERRAAGISYFVGVRSFDI